MTLYHDEPGVYAVFLDFASLHQKGPHGEARTDSEAALFGRALGSLSEWYSHPHTTVLKLTALPQGYPSGFSFPAGITPNTADYSGRGWCFTESAVAGLAKEGKASLDLGLLPSDDEVDGPYVETTRLWKACKQLRPPPLAPAEFQHQLEQKSFTSKKADLPTVMRLYEQAFESRLADVQSYSLEGLGWCDGEAKQLASVLATGALPKLAYINLRGNPIGLDGWKAIVAALWTLHSDGTVVSPALGAVLHDDDEAVGAGKHRSETFRDATKQLTAQSLAERRQINYYRQLMITDPDAAWLRDPPTKEWVRTQEAKFGWPPTL